MEKEITPFNLYVPSFDVSGILQESRENVAKNKKASIINSRLKRCLFINSTDVSKKLLHGKKLKKNFRTFNFDSSISHKSVREYIEKFKIQVIVIEAAQLTALSREMANDIIDARMRGIEVYEAHDFYELVNKRIPLIRFETDEYLANNVFSIGMHKFSDLYVKRSVDLLVSGLLLPLVFPILLVAILFILATSGSNPFFVQERVGRNSKKFKIYKLRTMVKVHNGDFTKNNDQRVTTIGRILRQTKIDELPQILNILKGEMSLIGPRPERPEFVNVANDENAYFDLRHLIKPGITGWAQVNLPKATPQDNLRKLEYDLYYIKNYDALLDLEIIYRTVKVVLSMESN